MKFRKSYEDRVVRHRDYDELVEQVDSLKHKFNSLCTLLGVGFKQGFWEEANTAVYIRDTGEKSK